MTVAQGINTLVKRVKQSGLGAAGSSGSKYMRRVTLDLKKSAPTYQSEEIVSHQQDTGDTEGPSKIGGTLKGELSPGSYDLEFAGLLRKDFAAAFTAITGASLTIAASGSLYTVTRAAGSFLTDGVKRGHVVRLSVGSLAAANIAKNLLVLGVTATVLTVTPLNGSTMTAEGPIATCTVSAPGKETHTPVTAHTNDYFTWEKWQPDVSLSDLFVDLQPGAADVSVPGTGKIGLSFDMVGLSRTFGGAEVLTSPSAASTSNTVEAVQGRIVVNGAVTAVTNVSFKIDGKTDTGEPEVGASTLSDTQRGKVRASGSFSAKFSSRTLQTIRDAQSVVTLMVGAADSALAAAEFIVFSFPAVKLFTDDPDDGEKQIVRTYTWTAQYNGSGGSGTDTHQTTCMIHDSLAA